MDQNGGQASPIPPAVQAIKDQSLLKDQIPRVTLERSASTDIRAEGAELQQAAEESRNVILDLTLDGKIRWASTTWQDVIGIPFEQVEGRPMADLIYDKQDAFSHALEEMRKNDSGSKIVRFSIASEKELTPEGTKDISELLKSSEDDDNIDTEPHVMNLEAQGILIFDRASGEETHTMWMIKPSILREVTIDLPPILVESLGVGAEMLAQYLTSLAENDAREAQDQSTPPPVLCRICERQITPWWFPKHSELCLQEHRAEAELQMAQENLTEHRNSIVKVLDHLEAQLRHKTLGTSDGSLAPPPSAEYKGVSIGPSSSTSSGTSSAAISRSSSKSGASRDRAASGSAHTRARSFTVRRPLARIVELVLDLCDTASEISTPSIKEPRDLTSGELRTQSPQSENRIAQVNQWQSPNVDNEPGLASLCDDTAKLSRSKVEAVVMFQRVLEYSERIRNEFTDLVQACIDAALQKAARVAAGDISSESSDESTSKGQNTDDEQVTFEQASSPEAPLDGITSIATAVSALSIEGRSTSVSPHRRALSSLSNRSSSPRGCATPRSHGSTLNSASQELKRLLPSEPESAAESDNSILSSEASRPPHRTESPVSDLNLSRPAQSRERKRTSLHLPRAVSSTRGDSPSRGPGPLVSPLKISKSRVPSSGLDNARSPMMSPSLSNSEYCSPTLPSHQQQPTSQPKGHHRRQSSVASSEVSHVPTSPNMRMSHAPLPRPAAPSIKDFEIIKPISKGAFGSVYLSKKKSTGDYYAIKALRKQDMVSKNQVANVKAERAILMWQGESDFVAKLFWTFPSKDYIFLVMEYLNGGDCACMIRALGTLPEDWAKRYMAEVVLGVEHLHDREIVHRDLKPDNLLIDQKGHLKLTDFGLSRMGLIGRQKRALNVKPDQVAQDPLKQGPFARTASIGSSRSASFDFQAIPSPGTTPAMTPVWQGDSGAPSYFNLSREASNGSRDNIRHNSVQYSDAGGDGEQLSAAFRRMSLFDDLLNGSRRSPRLEEEEPFDSYMLQKTNSGSSPPVGHSVHTPPPVSAMLPPPMALFDPDDINRRFVGTPDYLAPETINGVGQDEMSDWWSLGCILFEFMFGYPPFHADTPDQVFQNILDRKIEWPEDEELQVSPEAKDLMDRLMCIDPSQRLGANNDDAYRSGGEEIRKHPWFADIDWDNLNEAEASFIPAPENPEDTEYFDARGATTQDFAAEFDDQASSPVVTPGAEYSERPHDALSRMRTQVNSMKRGLVPLSIPAHVRDNGRTRRLSEPVAPDDFGQFSFKNLPILEKANKDVIQKLRAEAVSAANRPPQPPPKSATATGAPPSLEGSPVFAKPMRRAVSINKGDRSASPSAVHGFPNMSPQRGSQPSSPLVQFSAGNNHERRKTSSGSSQSNNSLQPCGFFEAPRLSTANFRQGSNASSPIRNMKSPMSGDREVALTQTDLQLPASPRQRSQTVGSNESDTAKPRGPHHQKNRSQALDISPSSSDNDDGKQKALLRVRSRRQSSRRMSQVSMTDGPIFRPLDVLVCEDHPVSRFIIQSILEKLRCRTIVVQNGAEAMRYAMSAVKFDVIMVEFKLPQVNGADVARMIRETKNANCHTPIVAVTGYLKELQAPHHFDALIEKPPTMPKFTDALSRLCQWKTPPPGWVPPPLSLPRSGLRNESVPKAAGAAKSNTGPPQILTGPFPGTSSREDSVSSASVFTDADVRSEGTGTSAASGPAHDLRVPMPGPLGSHSPSLAMASQALPPKLAALEHQHSAPAAYEVKSSSKSSSRDISPKPPVLGKERSDTGEFGDDEDEELGNTRARSRSPRAKTIPKKASNLATEMLRTDSQQSVISVVERPPMSLAIPSVELATSPPTGDSGLIEGAHASATTPPVLFPKAPGGAAKDIDMDASTTPTPRPASKRGQSGAGQP
ncbi:MAG: rim15, signal transduction response regulator [Chrysothrix sp. TS-e1954]|nr:MAG: rim15, signal transduction response regulator [Chrysothrix sp. TS-e1954]